jgi:hypothetical protein
MMVELRVPSGGPVPWAVRKKADASRLGVVIARLWVEAREIACQRYRLERSEIEVVPLEADAVGKGKPPSIGINGKRGKR